MKPLFGLSATVANNQVFFPLHEFLSPKVLALDGCFSREKPYKDHGGSLVWTAPQWMGPLPVAYII